MPGSDQWGRRIRLVLEGESETIDLSELRISFETRNADSTAPNTCYVRIYNLSRATRSRISKPKIEYKRLVLEAGYDQGENFGTIFDGTIKQVAEGNESPTDSYVDIWAADGDVFHNQATINKSLASGSTQKDVIDHLVKMSAAPAGDGFKFAPDAESLLGGFTPSVLSRGKTMFGMARSYGRDWQKNNDFRVSIQNGRVTLVPKQGYRKGEAVELSTTSGLIGIPVATPDGIHAQCLLNSRIHIGNLVRIKRESINRTTYQSFGLTYGMPELAPTTTEEGIYRVLVCEHVGDTRGQQWYSNLLCLAVDASADPKKSVAMQ